MLCLKVTDQLAERLRVRFWSEYLRFKFRAGKIGHSVANGSSPLQHSFERSCVAHKRNKAEMGPANS